MKRFRNLYINRAANEFCNTQYLSQAACLYSRWRKFLEDDYTTGNFVDMVERISPFFWVIVDDGSAFAGGRVAGFVYLENVSGDHEGLYKAEVNACFARDYWGDYVRESAERFFDYCFNTLGFRKLKALIYPQNFRVKNILQRSGFEKEGTLRAETLKNGKPQDVSVYAKIKAP
jgi:RimJ/RimL family protein N-acetyltransferase